LENKISTWLERNGKRAKGQVGFRGYHSTMDHLVMFRIIAEECRNDKTNLLFCFVNFRKYFDIVPRTSLSNKLEYFKVHFKLRVVVVRLYNKIISKFRNIEGWSKEINCNIGVNQGFPLSPTLFGIYIDKLEYCLEDIGCVGPTLASVVVILIYVGDIVLMAKSPYDLGKKFIILKDVYSNMGVTVNIEKTKVIIIKSKKITYDTCVL
jgi:hypothetical protein